VDAPKVQLAFAISNKVATARRAQIKATIEIGRNCGDGLSPVGHWQMAL